MCVIKSKSWSRDEGHLFHFPLWIFSSEKDYSLAHCAKSDEFHDYFFQKWIWLCNGLIDVVVAAIIGAAEVYYYLLALKPSRSNLQSNYQITDQNLSSQKFLKNKILASIFSFHSNSDGVCLNSFSLSFAALLNDLELI